MSQVASGLASMPTVKAWLDVEREAGLIRITPYARSSAQLTVKYDLIAEKSGRSGTTRNRQASRVKLQPGIDTSLSHLTLSRDSTDHYRFTLRVYQGDQLLAEDTLTLPAD